MFTLMPFWSGRKEICTRLVNDKHLSNSSSKNPFRILFRYAHGPSYEVCGVLHYHYQYAVHQ